MADYNIPKGLLAIQRRFLEAEARTAAATTPEDFQKAFKDQQQAATPPVVGNSRQPLQGGHGAPRGRPGDRRPGRMTS